MAELLNLQGKCQPLRAKPAHFVSHLPEAQRNAERGMQQPQHSDEIVTKESYVSSESASFLHRLSIFPLFTLIQVQLERASKFLSRDKGAIPVQHAASVPEKASTVNPQSPANQQCPNCGHAVRADATYCPNCRYQLSAISRGAPPTLNISLAPELPIIDKALASSTTTSQPEQARVKEAVLDDLAIQATLKRLWDKAGR